MRLATPTKRQRGAASLLIALVLMMSTTLITLSVAHTQVTETRMVANDNWHSRLRLLAQAEWEKAVTELLGDPSMLTWVPSHEGSGLISHITLGTDTNNIETVVTYHKSDNIGRLVNIQAVAGHPDGVGLTGRVSQMVLTLTVLSPRAETAPPLVINGCLSTDAAGIDIRPINSDRDDAGDAVWLFGATLCSSLGMVDVHGGRFVQSALYETLWSTLFSVNRDDYAQLVASELIRSAAQRRYWLAEAADLVSGKWTRSLGSTDTPVVLVFPKATGCPRFAGGVRIIGFVFIDSACREPLSDTSLEITGTLVINGNADAGNGGLRLNHIQTADTERTRLSFPVLRAVKIPGSWKDF